MKNKISSLVFCVSILLVSGSCKKYLDQVPDSVNFTDEQIFTDYTQSQKFIDALLVRGAYFDDNNPLNEDYNQFYGKAVYGTREKISDNTIPDLQHDWISGNSNRKGSGYNSGGDGTYWNEGDNLRFRTFWKAVRVAN
ncbi:MAG: hypothetical protein ABIS01_02165 [Ferruginibacter sp.]